jgi:hypothetical protein
VETGRVMTSVDVPVNGPGEPLTANWECLIGVVLRDEHPINAASEWESERVRVKSKGDGDKPSGEGSA